MPAKYANGTRKKRTFFLALFRAISVVMISNHQVRESHETTRKSFRVFRQQVSLPPHIVIREVLTPGFG